MGQAERVLLEAVARAVLRGDRGDLRDAARRDRGRRTAAGRPLLAAVARRRPSAATAGRFPRRR